MTTTLRSTSSRQMLAWGKVKPLTTYMGGPDHVLLIHHSFGFDSLEAVLAKPSRKVLVYHNVRPERFFSDPCMKRKLRLGRSQLSAYRPHVAYALATSNSNRRELLGRGYANVGVLPVPTTLEAFCVLKPDPRVLRKLKGSTNWLFGGPLVPENR